MPGKTEIEWTDATWNPVTGCTKVGPGCAHCYAETIARRFHKKLTGQPFVPWTVKAQRESGQPAVTLHPERLDQPLHWQKPCRIFVNSMSDLFHEEIPDDFILQVFSIMWAAKHHSFQVLTKRPDRMLKWFESVERSHLDGHAQILDPLDWNFVSVGWPLPNVWLGVSVENQRYADERVPLLLQTPAAVRFLSVEPMLGPVNLRYYLDDPFSGGSTHTDHRGVERYDLGGTPCDPIDWVICGGESGPKARPVHPDWVRSLRDQCQEAGVPFFFKQTGSVLARDWKLSDNKGGQISGWPEEFRVREFPHES